ncbi:hypothetical protein MPER_11232 [Moniliophthora perniciosa FA553]|nr:hypothetical protein MPER_11232 [Moniliophthora perniciosa FA553]
MLLTIGAKAYHGSTSTNWAFTFLVGEATLFCKEYIEWRLYPMHGFFCVCSFILVYPETKGVPLEEMDAVFGEVVWWNATYHATSIDAREEAEDNASTIEEITERTSLLSDSSHPSHQAINHARRRRANRGWFSRMLNGGDKRTFYPVST